MIERELMERVVALETNHETILATLQEILEEQKSTRAEINKYKGFIGSVWFVISCLGVFISAFKFFHRG
jgi:hypothetical protein